MGFPKHFACEQLVRQTDRPASKQILLQCCYVNLLKQSNVENATEPHFREINLGVNGLNNLSILNWDRKKSFNFK